MRPLEPLYHFETSVSDQDRIDEMYANDKARAEKNDRDDSGSDQQIESPTPVGPEIIEKN